MRWVGILNNPKLAQSDRSSERNAAGDDLERRFDERLAVLQQPQARDRLDALLAGRGKPASHKQPIAGKSF